MSPRIPSTSHVSPLGIEVLPAKPFHTVLTTLCIVRSARAQVENLARLPLVSQPGTEWRYSVGFDVLGAIIQRTSKMPFEQFLHERLLDPLDMKDTDFYVPGECAWVGRGRGFMCPVPGERLVDEWIWGLRAVAGLG
jgi:CubicO group peptidase (beta-lactamase class C family)